MARMMRRRRPVATLVSVLLVTACSAQHVRIGSGGGGGGAGDGDQQQHQARKKESKRHGSTSRGSTSRREAWRAASSSPSAAAAAAAAAAGAQRGNSSPSHQEHRTSGRRAAQATYMRTPALELGEEDEEEGGGEVQEPPAIVNISPKDMDLCSREDPSDYEAGKVCGPPFSEPCFDRSRCDQNGLYVYVYDQECSLADSRDLSNRNHDHDDAQHQSSYWRDALAEAGMLAETYEEACLFIHVNTHNHNEPCATQTPLWNGGANHVMMEFTPWWSYARLRPKMANTYAMDWAFDHHTCHYRSGYDLSLPLMPKVLFPKLAAIPATRRKFFLTFKGALYIYGFGVEERTAVSRMHDPANGVVSVVKCYELHNEHLQPDNKAYCDQARQKYVSYDYEDLMNTTYALVPAGRSPGTFRLGEVMSAGSIPVFIVRDWVKPYEEDIDWDAFSFTFSPDDTAAAIMDALRAVEPDELKEMQRKSLEAYWKIFAGAANYSVIARNSVHEIVRRFEGLGLPADGSA